MTGTADPKPPRTPVLPERPFDKQRRNQPIQPGGDAEHPIDEPPEEHARRQNDPQERDKL